MGEGAESSSRNECLEPGLRSTGSPPARADCGVVDALRGSTRCKAGRTLLTAGQQMEGLGALPAGAVAAGTRAGEFAQAPE